MKNIFKLTGILALSSLLVACTGSGQASNLNSNSPDNVKVVEVQKAANDVVDNTNQNVNYNETTVDADNGENSQENISAQVELSFPSEEYIVSGNEENKTVTQTIEVEGTEGDFVEKVLSALANYNSVDGAEATGIEKVTVKDSYLKDGVAVINFSSQGLNGSSLEEEVLIQSIVNSLLSVDQIKEVELRVDGEISESLMGHVDISEPFTKKL